MAIEQKDVSAVSQSLRSSYQKAIQAAQRNNADYAIELLKSVIGSSPGFMDARKKLRELESNKPPANPFTKAINQLAIAKSVAFGQFSVSRKKYRDAMRHAEDALAIDLHSLSALKLLAQAAEAEEAYFIQVEALEYATEKRQKDIGLLDALAVAYRANHQAGEALRVRQQIANLKPGDLDAQTRVREAAAAATMEKNEWENQQRSFTDKVKSKDEAAAMEQKDRIIRNIDDINDMIRRIEEQIEKEGESVSPIRQLGELNQRAGNHDKALECFNKATELIGSLDPTIDRMIEKSELGKIDQAIEQWEQYVQENPDSRDEAEQNIAAYRQQQFNYRRERAIDRVKSYPNDLQLRYELGVIYWEGEEIDDAIEQFQLAAKNPQRRPVSIMNMGRCFHAKHQYDLAVEQFEKALETMPSMDKTKMDTIYYLGLTYEDMNKPEKAIECFKQIYSADARYRDVGERVQRFYEQKSG